MINDEERFILMDACDDRCNHLKYFSTLNPALPTDGSRWHAMHRIPVQDLSSQEAKDLSADILLNRLLPRLQRELPGVAEEMLENNDLANIGKTYKLECSGFEPGVNRYETGGAFEPHTDDFGITINILLSDEGAFNGGGTAFYTQKPGGEKALEPSVKVEPEPGCAVVFNGNVWHEGLPVEKGVRHLYVACCIVPIVHAHVFFPCTPVCSSNPA